MTSSPRTDVDAAVQTRIRQQEVVAELGQQALETDDLDQLMHDAAAAVAETLDNEYAKVLELLPGGDSVFLRQGVGWRDDLVGNATVPTDRDSQAGYTLLSEEPIIVDDLRTEERFSGPELLTNHDVVSGISVIIGSVENPWGVLGTHTTEQREFTTHDANFVQSVANVLASAIEDTKTKQQLREREAELEEVYGRVTDGFLAVNGAWEFTHANDRATEILGVETDELIGKEIWTVFPDLLGTEFEAQYREAMATQEPVSIEEYYSPSDSWFEERIFPSESGLSIYFRDITEQRHLEQELEKTFNRITDAFIGLDRNWEITYVNERGSEILDPEDRGLVGKNFWDPFEPALGTTFEDEYRTAMETQEPTSFEEYYPPLGVWFEVHAYPSRSGLSIYFRDITERKERERELEESERRYRTLAEYFPNGLVTLFNTDLEYTLAAGQAFDELPVAPSDVEGGTPADVWSEAVAADLEPILRNTLERNDGETVEVEYAGRSWLIHAVPVTDETGNVFAGMTMAQDVTENRETQRQLRNRERELQQYKEYTDDILDAIDDVFYVLDDRGNVLRWNETLCTVTGYTDDEIESMRSPDFVTPEHRERITDAIEGAFRTGHTRVEAPFLTKDDTSIPFEFVASALEDPDGNPVLVGIGRNITERKAYERKLEESNERLEQFAYAASHDLQEPLRMVSSYLSLIERRYGDDLDDDAEEFLAFAVDGADRMREMIDGLLEYSRVDAQGDPLEPIELERVVENARDNLEVKIDESDAKITVESLPRVRGDAGQLHQVFQNLLSNAIEYSGDGPPDIRVDAERRGKKWMISVHDEGIGIDPADQDRVFDVFQRLHSREAHSGTGIGLALCQRIVERHGGAIWVDSEPGDGATFSFTLPAANET